MVILIHSPRVLVIFNASQLFWVYHLITILLITNLTFISSMSPKIVVLSKPIIGDIVQHRLSKSFYGRVVGVENIEGQPRRIQIQLYRTSQCLAIDGWYDSSEFIEVTIPF